MGPVRADADNAWDLAKSNPQESLVVVRDVLRRLDDDDPDRSVAIAARGRASFELGQNDQAIADLRHAAAATTGEFRDKVVMTLAAAVAAGGRFPEAVDLLTSLIDSAEGDTASETGEVTRGLARSQLGFLLMHNGDLQQAAVALDSATTMLRGRVDADALARILLNSGYCALMLDDLQRALDLLVEATELGQASDQTIVVATGLQNQAYAHSRLGDFPKALAQLEYARQWYQRTGDANRNLSTLYDDFAETYRLAGLTGDAVRHARQALDRVAVGGNVEKVADATYRLAVCLLDHGDHEAAAETADRAGILFREAGRPLWATRAMLVAAESVAAESAAVEGWSERAEQAIVDLEAAGWRAEALQLRNRLALLGLRVDDPSLIDRIVDPDVVADDPSVVGQLERLLHQAVCAVQAGEPATDSLREAWTTLQVHRHRLADPELRAGSGRLAEGLRFVDLTQALRDGEPADVLAAEERWRAASTGLPRARPSSDPAVAETAQRLRATTRRARAGDEPDRGLEQDIRDLEDQLRRSSHQAIVGPASPTSRSFVRGPDLAAQLRDRLGERAFVEWFEHRRSMFGVGVQAGEVEIWEIGAYEPIRSAANRIRRDLARLLVGTWTGATLERRWRQLTDRATALGDQVLPADWRASHAVLCPPGALQELPWALITGDRSTGLSVSLSAISWLDRRDRTIPTAKLAILRGPDLGRDHDDLGPGAERFSQVARTEMADRSSLAVAVAAADLVHIAAHGSFRADNPMFSSVRLHDGEFALHELADFERLPPVVALAACDAGRSRHLERGSEQLGPAQAWLGSGAESVIAPICAVPDAETARFFQEFYDALPGTAPAVALGRAWAGLADADPLLAATAAAFLCYGSGGPSLGHEPGAT